ncbi:hypothetical protein EDC01DRAFT_756168, partial [Geopyxis carbonaria]
SNNNLALACLLRRERSFSSLSLLIHVLQPIRKPRSMRRLPLRNLLRRELHRHHIGRILLLQRRHQGIDLFPRTRDIRIRDRVDQLERAGKAALWRGPRQRRGVLHCLHRGLLLPGLGLGLDLGSFWHFLSHHSRLGRLGRLGYCPRRLSRLRRLNNFRHRQRLPLAPRLGARRLQRRHKASNRIRIHILRQVSELRWHRRRLVFERVHTVRHRMGDVLARGGNRRSVGGHARVHTVRLRMRDVLARGGNRRSVGGLAAGHRGDGRGLRIDHCGGDGVRGVEGALGRVRVRLGLYLDSLGHFLSGLCSLCNLCNLGHCLSHLGHLSHFLGRLCSLGHFLSDLGDLSNPSILCHFLHFLPLSHLFRLHILPLLRGLRGLLRRRLRLPPQPILIKLQPQPTPSAFQIIRIRPRPIPGLQQTVTVRPGDMRDRARVRLGLSLDAVTAAVVQRPGPRLHKPRRIGERAGAVGVVDVHRVERARGGRVELDHRRGGLEVGLGRGWHVGLGRLVLDRHGDGGAGQADEDEERELHVCVD